MTLLDAIEIWKIRMNSDFWNDINVILHEKLDKEALYGYLMQEYGNMEILDTDSIFFHNRVITFFKIHKWNIDKLTESMYFDYDPIGNTVHHTHTTWERDEEILNEKIENDVWTEKGHTDEQDVHLISADNDIPADLDNLKDTEDFRDVIDVDYSKEGTDDKTTNTDQVEDENYDGTVDKWGHESPASFQELIEEERQQAQFNIYKWIGKHFCHELLVAIW